jgi:hypothetical protein
MHNISSHTYSVEGITNCFFIRHRRAGHNLEPIGEQFESLHISSISFIIMQSIREVQKSLYKMFNNCRIGQVLKTSAKIQMHPMGWMYIKEKLVAQGLQLAQRLGNRTEKVILPELMKHSVKVKVHLEIIKITSSEEMRIVKGIFGRYCGIGSRRKYPKAGLPPEAITYGTNLNVFGGNGILVFEYTGKYTELNLKCRYTTVTAHDDISL